MFYKKKIFPFLILFSNFPHTKKKGSKDMFHKKRYIRAISKKMSQKCDIGGQK